MVRNGNGTKWLWYEMAMVRNGYGTKMIFTMVRNGRYEMVMVRNDCNSYQVINSMPDFIKVLNIFFNYWHGVPYLGLHNAHPLLALKISRKKLVRVYNAHGLLKKIVVGNIRIKYQSYIFFSPLGMFHLLGEL
jgi:hypothetical protein